MSSADVRLPAPDGTVHTGVAGGTVFTDPGWSTAANPYLLNLTSGVSDLQLTRI